MKTFIVTFSKHSTFVVDAESKDALNDALDGVDMDELSFHWTEDQNITECSKRRTWHVVVDGKLTHKDDAP